MVITNKTENIHTLDYVEGQVVLIDKELGWTSNDLVLKIRNLISKQYQNKKIKVGHGGSLDPLASGLMIVCIGKETKNQNLYQMDRKAYRATIKLGYTTPSFDRETEESEPFPTAHITESMIQELLVSTFTGEIIQIPPIYSAKNINGKRAHELARDNKPVELKAQTLTIYKIQLEQFESPFLKLYIECSKGTYIRSLANDIGKALGSGAYLTELIRVSCGQFKIEDACTIQDFVKKIKRLENNNENIS